MSLDLDHWSSPNGCHEDCPACAAQEAALKSRAPRQLMKYFLIEVYEVSGSDPRHEVWHQLLIASRSLTGALLRGAREAKRWWSDPHKTKCADSTCRLTTLDGKTDYWPCPLWDSFTTFTHGLHSLKEVTRSDYEVLRRHL